MCLHLPPTEMQSLLAAFSKRIRDWTSPDPLHVYFIAQDTFIWECGYNPNHSLISTPWEAWGSPLPLTYSSCNSDTGHSVSQIGRNTHYVLLGDPSKTPPISVRWWVHTLTVRLGVWQWLRTRITFSKNLDSPIFFNLSNIFYRLEVGGELRMKSCVSIIFSCKSCGGGLASNLERDFIVWGSWQIRLSELHFNILSLEAYIGNRKYWLPSVGNVFAQGSHGRENFSHMLFELFLNSLCVVPI